jgi:hypothetical protein
MDPQNPTVIDRRQSVSIGNLNNRSRLKSSPGKLVSIRSKVLFPKESFEENKQRQQVNLPDRRYGINNHPEMQLGFYNKVESKPVTVGNFVYRKHGVPYIPACQILEDQPAKNFFDADPSNSTQVVIPDLYYQEQDRLANPRTIDDNAVAKSYERQMGNYMTNYLLRHVNHWNRHMISNYANQNPDRFYKPIYSDEIDQSLKQQKAKYDETKSQSEIYRNYKGNFVKKRDLR